MTKRETINAQIKDLEGKGAAISAELQSLRNSLETTPAAELDQDLGADAKQAVERKNAFLRSIGLIP